MRTIYVKYSNERKKEYQIKTIIKKNDSVKEVYKIALNEEGIKHIENICLNYQRLISLNKDTSIVYADVERVSENEIKFPFIHGPRFSDTIVELIENKKYQDVMRFLKEYFTEIKKSYPHTELSCRQDLFFGDPEKFIGDEVFTYANLDLILDNIILEKDRFIVIDYEWVVDGNIPVGFIGYRILSSIPYFDNIPTDIADEIYDAFGVRKELFDEYANMETQFHKYVSDGCVKLDDLYNKMNPSLTDLRLIKEVRTNFTRKICGWQNDTEVEWLSENVLVNNGHIQASIPEDYEKILFYPLNASVVLKIDKAIGTKKDGTQESIKDFLTNADYFKDSYFYMNKNDLYIGFMNAQYTAIDISYTICHYDNPLISDLINDLKQRDMLVQAVEKKNAEILEVGQKYEKQLLEISQTLAEKNAEILSVGDKLSETVQYCDKITNELHEHIEMLNEARKHLKYIINANPIKAMKYINQLKKTESE